MSTVCLTVALGMSGSAVLATEIIAHRGASYDAPENTRPAVELAWEQNSDAVELDVYLTKDNQIVAIHDRTPKRYGGPDRLVEEMTWDELQKLDVGLWKDARWQGVKIPLLSELLPLIPDGKRVFIEIKSGPQIVSHLKTVLKESGLPNQKLVIIAFSEDVVAETRKQLPELTTFWLVSLKQDQKTGEVQPSAEQIIKIAKRLNVPGVNFGGAIQQPLVQKVREAGFDCYAWTINDVGRARELASWGVIGITTDRPAVIREGLQNRAE